MNKLATMVLFALTLAVGTLVFTIDGNGVKYAEAGKCKKPTSVNCEQPTGVGKGKKVPVWKVRYCVIGRPGNYTKVDCKSSTAVHRAPTGNMAVCFVGTDGKVHWDYQREVHVGRPFINHRVGGRWQPDWQDARPY